MDKKNEKYLHLVLEDGQIDPRGEVKFTDSSEYSYIFYVKEYLEAKNAEIKRLREGYETRTEKAKKNTWTDDKIKAVKADYAATQSKIREVVNDRYPELLEQFSDVRFVYCLANDGLTGDNNSREFRSKVYFQDTVPDFVVGGGKIYLEAVREGQHPQNKPPYGVYISALGDPKILGIVWTDYDDNILSKDVAPGSSVLLHIFTKDMYGQDLSIQLMDKDFGGDEELPNEDTDSKDEKEVIQLHNKICEVNVYPLGKSDVCEKRDGDLHVYSLGQKVPHVQKAILEVKISKGKIWSNEAGNFVEKLHIYPKITSVKDQKIIYNSSNTLLEINYNPNSDAKLYQPKTYKSPILTGKVNTSFASFSPCFYTYIKAVVDDLPEVVLFEEKDPEKTTATTFNLPFTAGVNQGLAQLSILLDTDTSNCLYETIDKKKIHEHRVVDLSHFKHLQSYGLITGDFIQWDSEEIFKDVGQGKIADKSENKVGGSVTFKVPFGANLDVSAEFKLLEEPTPFKLHASDREVKLNVGYDYTNRRTQHPLMGLAKTIWPNNSNIAQSYPIIINTCRYSKKTIYVNVYPDVKWTLQIGFNYNAEKFEQVQNAYHNRWDLIGESHKSSSRRPGLTEAQRDEFRRKSEEAFQNRGSQSGNRVRRALLNPKNALAADIIDLKVGLICELDDDKIKIEASDIFPEVTDFLKKILKITKKVEQILDGTDNQAANETLEMHPARQARLQQRVDARRPRNKKIDFKFIPPEIGLSISWQAERPKDIDKPEIGTTFTGKIDANPLFGYKITFDIFDLMGKAIPHPAVKAAIIMMQFLDEIAGDNFDIKFDLVITGKVKLEGEGKISSVANSHVGSDNPFKLEGEIKIKIEAEVVVQGTKDTFLFGEVGAYAKLGGDVTTGITFAGSIEAQKEGLFVIPYIEFHGIVLNGKAKGGIVKDTRAGTDIDEDKDLEDMPGIHIGGEGQIVAMQPYRWDLAEWKIPIMN